MKKISFQKIMHGLKRNERREIMGGCGGWYTTNKQLKNENPVKEKSLL